MITLSNEITIAERYSGTSKYKFWPELEVGDVISVSVTLRNTGRGNAGMYSPAVCLNNRRTGKSISVSFNESTIYLSKIKYDVSNKE